MWLSCFNCLCSGEEGELDSKSVYQTTVSVSALLLCHSECTQITDIKCVCCGRGREEFLSSRCHCVLLCFVSVQFVSRIREVTQSYFHNRRAWENTNISLLKTHSPVCHTLTCLTFCLLELLPHELPYSFL